jgi:hypothetical protein
MVQLGLEKRWWPNVQQSPLTGFAVHDYVLIDDDAPHIVVEDGPAGEAVAAEPAGAAAAAAPDPPVKSVKLSSDDALRTVRKSFHNTIDFACHILTDQSKLRRLDCHWFLQEHYVTRFRHGLVDCHTYMGQVSFYDGLASFGLSSDIRKMWGSIQSDSCLTYCGLARSTAVSESKLQEDDGIAALLVDAALHHSFLWAVLECAHTYGLPKLLH